MKTKITTLTMMAALAIACLAFGSAPAQKAGMCSLTVKVVGLRNNNGKVNAGLFNNEETWLNYGKPFKGAVVATDKLKAVAEFKNIPCGTYAVAVFHDENGNGTHDKNHMGLPREGYGFSNKARGQFGPAKFSEAKFELRTAMQQELITITYIR